MIGSNDLAGICQAILRECLDEGDITSEDSVHRIRIATKKLRSAWQLLQYSTDRKFAKSRKAALRKLSASLSSDRDRAVLLGLADEMGVRHPDVSFVPVREFLLSKNGSISGGGNLSVEDSLHEGISAWEKVREFTVDEKFRIIRRCIRRNRNRARRASVNALADSDAEVWHDWRKAVKRLRYQREFLAALQGREAGLFDDRIRRLGTALGKRNDLANLTLLIDEMKEDGVFSGKEYGQFRRVIASEERGIVKNCRRLGRITFLSKK